MIFGDVRHTAGQSFNVESGSGNDGIFPRPGDQLANLNKYGEVLRDYCVSTDPICGGGDVVDTHLNYFDVFTEDVASWVQERVGSADPSSTSSQSASSTSSDSTTSATTTSGETSESTSSATDSETTSMETSATMTATGSEGEETETETETGSPSATETGENVATGLRAGGSATALVFLAFGLHSLL